MPMTYLPNHLIEFYIMKKPSLQQERRVKFNINVRLSTLLTVGKVADLKKLCEERLQPRPWGDVGRMASKIPSSISVSKTHATVSEVAMFSFLRWKDVPVPEVYGRSSTADNEPGTEYIIHGI